MKSLAAAGLLITFGLLALVTSSVTARTMAPTPNPNASQAAQLQELTKKLEEQNAKIDMLSPEILRLQIEIENHCPGVMSGARAPSSSASTSTTSSSTAT